MTNYLGVATDDVSVSSLSVGGATPLTKLRGAAVSFTPAATAATSAVEQTVTVSGAVVGDAVSVTPPGTTAGVAVASARVSAANTVAVMFVNPTAGSLTAPSGSYVFLLAR